LIGQAGAGAEGLGLDFWIGGLVPGMGPLLRFLCDLLLNPSCSACRQFFPPPRCDGRVLDKSTVQYLTRLYICRIVGRFEANRARARTRRCARKTCPAMGFAVGDDSRDACPTVRSQPLVNPTRLRQGFGAAGQIRASPVKSGQIKNILCT
jgi:hypothetical protein